MEDGMFDAEDLIKKALSLWQLGLYPKIIGGDYICSEQICSYGLTPDLIARLRENGLTVMEGPNRIIIISGRSEWRFKKGKEQLTLHLVPYFDEKEMRIFFYPSVAGPYIFPDQKAPGLAIFEAVAMSHPKEHPLIDEMVAKKGALVVTMADIQMEGIKAIWKLFVEFTRGNNNIVLLALSNMSPFSPEPYHHPKPHELRPVEKKRLWVPKPAQLPILNRWRKQLEKFQENLSIAED